VKIVEYDSRSPEEAVALDELLLLKAEAGGLGETLRLWSAEDHFVVIGRAAGVSEDCFPGRCRRSGVKIIRRISGGHAVLQGPGCFNYSAVLSYERDGRYKDVRQSYRRILEGISDAFKVAGLDVEFFPVSDLALDGKKISGNAQARKRKYFLHHGTFLFDFDLDRISFYLRHPSTEPEYRRGRAHGDFLANIPVTAGELEDTIKKVFLPSPAAWKPDRTDLEELREIVTRKYSRDAWNYAF